MNPIIFSEGKPKIEFEDIDVIKRLLNYLFNMN